MPIDIEYPLPGDIVGPVFSVGGSYDGSWRESNKAPNRGPLPAGSQITLTLVGAEIVTLVPLSPSDKTGQDDTGPWNFTVTTDGGEHPDIVIIASFRVGTGGTPESDTVEDVDVRGEATGTITVKK